MSDVPELLDYIEERTDLDVVAITDHDHIRGAWRAREVWANRSHRFEVVVGIEITTTEGHLLGLFLEDPVDSLVPLEEAIEAVHRQNGLCVVPHPTSRATRSLSETTLLRIASNGTSGFQAIETSTGSPIGRIWTARAQRINREHLNLAEIGASDAHFATSVGTAHTEFKGRTAKQLRRSILNGTTNAVRGKHPSLFEPGLGGLVRQTWRGMQTTPRTMGLGRTARSFYQSIFDTR